MHFTPVQIIGTQRSGSNLLRLMLNQLDGVSAPHPPHILERFMPLLPLYGPLSVPSNFLQLVKDVCSLIECNPVPWTGIVLNQDKIVAACRMPALTEIFRVIYEMKSTADNARIWVCKSMVNIRFADQLEANAVNPLYLHLVRDGRDVALSFMKAVVGEKHIYFIAKQWKEEQDACMRLMDQLGNKRVIRVKYEELITRPEAELRKICDFIGASFSYSALDYYKSKESKNTAVSGVMWKNVQKPIIADNYNKYIKELSNTDIGLFENVAGDTLQKLGYNCCFPLSEKTNFTREEISAFSAVNQTLKEQARLKQSPEDFQKRKKQEDLLREIKIRVKS